ncbi:mechanosensitive ion channel protein [Actibacterium mucosum KCTC 23349]|uniref:Mechanosensitive ion channel protein n=1 Tax=Actibacterium mucosum KCTC 23349 TaxID=1454373 RepID=A0A037ZMY7_9RHOB|nr:mechanosensitive ion channel domain-containing protein [Actibacterium mucosum]KAJ57429.1 mechanosensitive ion channel protein [Actibacterium mucosum KCTC 23349]
MEQDTQIEEATTQAPGDNAPAETAAEAAQEALELGQIILTRLGRYADSAFSEIGLYQIAGAIGLFLIAHLLAAALRRPFHEWLRRRAGWPKWRIRVGLVIHRRLRMIFFVAVMWIALSILREVTWPSRSYLFGILTNLATAWLVVILATRLIHSPLLRWVVRYGAWVYVTLSILGIVGEAASLLDTAALEFGGTRISLLLIVQAVVALGALFYAARFLSSTTASRVQKVDDMSPSMQVLVVKFVQVLLYGAAFFIGLKTVGVDLTGLAVLSGAIGVGLGFGLQKVVSNLVSGIIILLDKSIKPGDVISLGETFGWINALGARYVSVVTRDGREYLIPNEDLITNQVVNWSHTNDFVRLDIHFGTAYDDDPHKVRAVAIEAAKSVDRVLTSRPPVCHVVGFGDSSVDYILRFWINDPTGGLTNIRGAVYLALWDAFQEHGFSIPFPQREVRVLSDQASASSISPG